MTDELLRKLAADLSRPLASLCVMFEPGFAGHRSFVVDFIPAVLKNLFDMASSPHDHHEPVLLLAGFCAAVGLTPKEIDQKIKDGFWRDFEIRHVAEYRGEDGTLYIDKYDGSKDALRVFWGIYGSGPAEELPMHIVDVSYGSMALTLVDALRRKVKACV